MSSTQLRLPKRRGASGLTYGLIVGLISILAIAAINQIGSNVNTLMSGVATRIAGAAQPRPSPSPVATGSYSFDTCGATGPNGPTNCSYSGANAVTVSSGYQAWVVPQSGTYTITVRGAAGGVENGRTAGRGAILSGRFALNAGETLLMVVGQVGVAGTACAGGGGGTFVARGSARASATLLIAAGGGGGTGASGGNGFDANTIENGVTSPHNGYAGGTNGGGANGGGGWGGGGAGFSGDGLDAQSYGTNALSFRNGATGGLNNQNVGSCYFSHGGFGGGGHGQSAGGGGAGGYSGGSGGGGGGGSFNSGSSPSASVGNTGAGSVTIVAVQP